MEIYKYNTSSFYNDLLEHILENKLNSLSENIKLELIHYIYNNINKQNINIFDTDILMYNYENVFFINDRTRIIVQKHFSCLCEYAVPENTLLYYKTSVLLNILKDCNMWNDEIILKAKLGGYNEKI